MTGAGTSDNSEILKALTRGIESEIAAYVFYPEADKIVDDERLKSVLEMLAVEEKKHFLVPKGNMIR